MNRIRAKSLAGWVGLPLLLLLIPLCAMQLTPEVVWTVGDFFAAGLLLGSAGAGCYVVRVFVQRLPWRTVTMAGIVGCVSLLWIEGAVGLFA